MSCSRRSIFRCIKRTLPLKFGETRNNCPLLVPSDAIILLHRNLVHIVDPVRAEKRTARMDRYFQSRYWSCCFVEFTNMTTKRAYKADDMNPNKNTKTQLINTSRSCKTNLFSDTVSLSFPLRYTPRALYLVTKTARFVLSVRSIPTNTAASACRKIARMLSVEEMQVNRPSLRE